MQFKNHEQKLLNQSKDAYLLCRLQVKESFNVCILCVKNVIFLVRVSLSTHYIKKKENRIFSNYLMECLCWLHSILRWNIKGSSSKVFLQIKTIGEYFSCSIMFFKCSIADKFLTNILYSLVIELSSLAVVKVLLSRAYFNYNISFLW